MLSQNIGKAFLIIGSIIYILALVIDFIGLGGFPGYGYKQITGLIVGTIAINTGAFLKKKS